MRKRFTLQPSCYSDLRNLVCGKVRDQDADLQPISITSVSRSPEWHVVAGSQIGIYLEPLRRSILRYDLRQSLTPDSHFQSSGAPCCSDCTLDVLVSQSCIQTTTTPPQLSPSPFSFRRGSKPTKIQKSRETIFDCSVAVLRVVPFDNTNTLVPSGIYDWHRQLQMFCNPDKPRCNERGLRNI